MADTDVIDIKTFLDEQEIPYRDRGKNVSKGWVNIEVCPFCSDDSYHCGINLSSLMFHCWVCNEKGHMTRLLKSMEQFKGINIRNLLDKHQTDYPINNLEPVRVLEECKMPGGLLKDLPVPHFRYLQSRGFDPLYLQKEYKLQAVWNVGDPPKYRFRIIAPIFVNGEMISFVAASVVRDKKEVIPYLNADPTEVVVPVNHTLYNYDSVENVAVIVEGITDVWRCGAGFIASFRKEMTSEQIVLLKKKNPKRIFVFYDPDALKQATELADNLSGQFSYVERLDLDVGDPADLTPYEVHKLRSLIFE